MNLFWREKFSLFNPCRLCRFCWEGQNFKGGEKGNEDGGRGIRDELKEEDVEKEREEISKGEPG